MGEGRAKVVEEFLDEAYIAIKIRLNQVLYDKGYITEEMYVKAKELILQT